MIVVEACTEPPALMYCEMAMLLLGTTLCPSELVDGPEVGAHEAVPGLAGWAVAVDLVAGHVGEEVARLGVGLAVDLVVWQQQRQRQPPQVRVGKF